jgi:hypothetical protein
MSEMNLKLVSAVEEQFNLILSNNNIDKKFEFEKIVEIYDKLLLKIAVVVNKKSEEYEKGKKKFKKFLNYNYNFLKNHLEVDEDIIVLFEDAPNGNWNLLFLSFMSYLTYLIQTNPETNINYKSMANKLFNIIKKSDSDSDSEIEEQPNINTNNIFAELNKHMQPSDKTPGLMNNLLGDIKNVLQDGSDMTNILDVSKNLSQKYQTMIENGDVNMSDLLSGVMGLLNNPDSLNEQFKDIDASKLPNPDTIMANMASDPGLKEAMSMLNSDNGGMFGAMMSSMMNGKSDLDGKNIVDLDREIEQMIREVQEKEVQEKEDKLD